MNSSGEKHYWMQSFSGHNFCPLVSLIRHPPLFINHLSHPVSLFLSIRLDFSLQYVCVGVGLHQRVLSHQTSVNPVFTLLNWFHPTHLASGINRAGTTYYECQSLIRHNTWLCIEDRLGSIAYSLNSFWVYLTKAFINHRYGLFRLCCLWWHEQNRWGFLQQTASVMSY